MSEPTPPSMPPQVAEIERHLKWSALSTVLFIAILLGLAGMGIASLTMKPRHPQGLPDDPDAVAATELMSGQVSAATNSLRWSAALLGGEPVNRPPDAAMLRLSAAARTRLDAARRRAGGDPRPLAALAALDLVAHDYSRAAAHYRRACEAAPRYGEARLGAGVALALEADRTPEPWQSRALRLQAIAEFAMVDSTVEEYPLALYNRVLVLRDVDRTREAAYWAARYLAVDDTSAWSAEMQALVQ